MSAELVLGTAQFGLDYGVTNKRGQTEFSEVEKILDFANANEISSLDTSPAYGESESIVGKLSKNRFSIMTKAEKVHDTQISGKSVELIKETFYKSLERLRCDKIETLLIHRDTDLLMSGADRLISLLESLKEQNLVQKIGVSCYDTQTLKKITEQFDIDVAQAPLSIFDQRFLDNDVLRILKEKQIELHVRSVFLQGIVLAKKCPDFLSGLKPVKDKLAADALRLGCSKMALALGILKNKPFLHKVIVGVENLDQLIEIYDAFSMETPEIDYGLYRVNDENLILPPKWRKQT